MILVAACEEQAKEKRKSKKDMRDHESSRWRTAWYFSRAVDPARATLVVDKDEEKEAEEEEKDSSIAVCVPCTILYIACPISLYLLPLSLRLILPPFSSACVAVEGVHKILFTPKLFSRE